MAEKAAPAAWVLLAKFMVQRWLKILTMGTFLGILILWELDGLNFNLNYPLFLSQSPENLNFTNTSDLNTTHQILENDIAPQPTNFSNLNQTHHNLDKTHQILENNIAPIPSHISNLNQTHQVLEDNIAPQPKIISNLSPQVSWISAEFEANYSSNLLAKWLTPGGEPCKDSKSVDIRVHSLDNNSDIELSSGEIHEFVFQALGDSGMPICLGGDYFETDLSGEKWKARPPIKDIGNGSYTFSLQVHPAFAGDYNLTITLLFRHYEGLKFSPERFTFDRVLRVIPIRFIKSEFRLPEISHCKKCDYSKDVWSGRWTRHARNDSCLIDDDGRYRCQEASFPCQLPWCDGPLGLLESNGWVYSAHCSFKMFTSEESWNCLNNRWIFWWGDSNHCDTIRNILYFFLNVHDLAAVPRIFDMNITNPKNPSQMIRFTSIFNGHPNDTGNYEGLNSLINAAYREKLKGYFSGDVIPDTMIMNSGLHDGVHWSNIRRFIGGADYAARFWAEVMGGVRSRGLEAPEIIYRTTVATGGYARRLAYNPNKMEAFNGVVLEKLRQYGVVDKVIDDFDMTYPWHYDNRCNDGVHYGRAPLKMKWRDGEIGHQYFVDLMLGHVLLNALCAR